MTNKKIKGTRRNFIKSSIDGIAGATIVPSVLKGDAQTNTEEKKKKRKLVYRTLGKTGIKLPVVSIGAQARDPKIYSAALDVGLVHLDTSHNYGNGAHETMLANLIKGRPRDSFVVGTKAYEGVDNKTGLVRKGTKGDGLVKKLEISLKRLGLEYVDVFYLHSVVKGPTALYEPFLTALEKLKKQGKTKFVGVTTHTNEPEVIMAAAKSKVYDVILTAYNFRQPHLKKVQAAIDFAVKSGLGIVAMKTQAGTFWDRERKNQINMKAALKWALQNNNIHTTIPGFTTFDQLETDISVMENLTLTPEEITDLKLGEKLSLTGLYCAQCANCIPQCESNINIPVLMRSFMYVYGHKNPLKAKETLNAAGISKVACTDCYDCNVKCTMGFNVRERMLDIARIKDVPEEFLA